MKEKMTNWLEKEKRLQQFIRYIFFYSYLTPEKCRLAILQSIESSGAEPETESIQLEIYRRTIYIKAAFVYAPITLILLFHLFLFGAALKNISSPVAAVSLLISSYLIIIYRVTFLEYYLSSFQSLRIAKNKMLASLGKPATSNEKVGIHQEKEGKSHGDLSFSISPYGPQQARARESTEKEEAEEWAGVQKGTIATILLNELIKKECGRPCLFSGDIEKAADFHVFIAHCKKKNLLDKAKTYRRREAIRISSENSRSTHVKYLSVIADHFREIGDTELYKQAEDLRMFILTHE